MAQPPLLRNPQLPAYVPAVPAQNLAPQDNNHPPIQKLNLLSQPNTAVPMSPSNRHAFGESASSTPVLKPATLQRPTLPTVQPQQNLSGSPAATSLPKPLTLKRPTLPTQKITANQVSSDLRIPLDTTLPVMSFNDPASGINNVGEDASANSDYHLLGYSPLDQDSDTTQNFQEPPAQRTAVNPPRLFRLPSALNVQTTTPPIAQQAPIPARLQGQVFAASFNKSGNPILPGHMPLHRQNVQPPSLQVQETAHFPQPHPPQRNVAQPPAAKRQLDTLIPKYTPGRVDLSFVNIDKKIFPCDTDNSTAPGSDTNIIDWKAAMNDSSALPDMLWVSETEYQRAEKILSTPTASTTAPEPLVYKPFSNVFGKKTGWKIDLQEKYFQPVNFEQKLLPPNSAAAQLGLQLTAEDLTNQLASIQVISFLPEKDANYVAFNRDVFHCPPRVSSETLNQGMLKSQGSAVRSGEEKYRQPSNQVSVLLDTLFKPDGNGSTVPVSVLSVSAPAMDDNAAAMNAINSRPVKFARPEMQTYIDFTSASSTVAPVFKADNYQTACETLRTHVVKGAQLHSTNKNSSGRVIMCAYGVKAFLSALREVIDTKYGTEYAKTATAIMAQEFAKTVTELRMMGQEVSFSDISKYVDDRQEFVCQDFWDLVNANLKSAGQDELKSVNGFDSKLGQNWVKKGDLIINAWDPDSLLGNALVMDNSFDGHLGRRSTIHLTHALACRLFHSPENKPGAQIKIKLKI